MLPYVKKVFTLNENLVGNVMSDDELKWNLLLLIGKSASRPHPPSHIYHLRNSLNSFMVKYVFVCVVSQT